MLLAELASFSSPAPVSADELARPLPSSTGLPPTGPWLPGRVLAPDFWASFCRCLSYPLPPSSWPDC